MVECGLTPCCGWPLYSTCPPEVGFSPVIMRSSVDLPQPDGPSKHTNSPGWIAKLTSCTAVNCLGGIPYKRDTFLSSSSGTVVVMSFVAVTVLIAMGPSVLLCSVNIVHYSVHSILYRSSAILYKRRQTSRL